MPNPKICLYAEALTHIRQLTLHASLQTEKNEHTKILISSDKKIIAAVHDGETSSIYLPTQISGTVNATFPTDKRTEISVRLQIDDQFPASGEAAGGETVEVPWSAGELSRETAIACKKCGTEILAAGKVGVWKDLPSDHWAELMDLWFCHKPHDDHGHGHGHEHGGQSDDTVAAAAEAKGFSATSKVADARPGTGLVDVVSFLLHRDDCANVQVQKTSNDSKKNTTIVKCDSCSATVGSTIQGETSVRMYKSRLKVSVTNKEDSWEEYPTAVFLCAQLLSLIESSVSRKVVVHDEVGSQGLLIWVFNPDIYYSSSKRGPTAHRAMKVFYKTLDEEPGKFLETSGAAAYEELVVPAEDYEEFTTTLRESTDVLPQAARLFQDWNVGLLDRWEKKASGSMVLDGNPLNRKVEEGFEVFKLPAGMAELYL
ncbi:ubiquitin-conjugating enzyme E2-binding protein [Exophiala viscosa]|uniref:ubiquitin-conjugating enzyme E2-binding protein n=1 Tax=Exophiala viscosa TaxID=2486360 RepID=UPI00218F1DD4|nr:ubiquitin-conjugating enzyme E2-binding protein [Exophiala viscosa]